MRHILKPSLCLFLAGQVLTLPGLLHADTVTLPAAADTFINAAAPGNNAGNFTGIDAGTDGGNLGSPGVRRTLIRFDLSSLPSGAVITSAVLRLTVTKLPTLGVDSSFALHRLTAAWGEGTKIGPNGALASVGEATWNDRMQGTASWTSPGAMSDVIAGASATTPVSGLAAYAWGGPGVLADVWHWQTNSAANFGWLLKSLDETSPRSVRMFGALNSGATAPVLEIGYTPPITPNTPPVVSIIQPTNGASFIAPVMVTLTATATDSDGSVTNVEFFDGATSLGSVTASPYTIGASLNLGGHTLTAVAKDNQGAATTSAAVNISVANGVIADPFPQRIPKGAITVELATVAAGMASPLGMAVPDDGSGRMFVHDQDGRVWIISGGTRLAVPLLDVSGRLVNLGAYDERGLLGLATHPNFSANPYLYTYTSEPNGNPADFQNGLGTTNNHQSVVAEWRISLSNSNQVDLASRREILRIDQPQSNHNGGAMHFGPDGLLYISLGDGGQANDIGAGHVPGGNAQDLSVIWGKMLRIDPRGNTSANGQYGIPASNPFVGAPGLDEIYAYGLRNAFTFSFDRQTGALYIADVGQNKVEEINLGAPGANYGWNMREGSFWYDATNVSLVTAPVRPPPASWVDPIAQYDHDDGLAVIGGYVYRGAAIPALAGRYVFGDWGAFNAPSGRLFYLDSTNGVNELILGLDDRRLGMWIKGFGEGPDGELYVFANRWLGPSGVTGRMLKLVPAPAQVVQGAPAAAGGQLNTSWTGGGGPFAVQRQDGLGSAAWFNAAFTAGNSASLPMDGPAGFQRVKDLARQPAMPFSAYLSGGSEVPSNASTGTGLGLFSLDGNTLAFAIRFGGLSAALTAAHIHGPAGVGTNAGVLLDLSPHLGPGAGQAGHFSGVVLLTDTQKLHLLSGRCYINVHTSAFPGGEIRGQIVPVNFQVTLRGAYEVPSVASPGTGSGNLLLVGNQLTFNIHYRGLLASATAAHIHGPASTTNSAGVLEDLGFAHVGAFAAQGAFSGSLTLTPARLNALIDGKTYVNIHSGAVPGGEIRGQIQPQATGVPFSVLLSGLAEKPAALTNTASGAATLSLDGNLLTFNLAYSGLSGMATAAHIHGFTNTAQNAGVVVSLAPFNGGAFGTAGSLAGSVTLTHAQRDNLLNGQTYINIHTAANPAGEMRGQIAPVLMSSGLSGKNERNTPVPSPGSGLGVLALVRDKLTMVVTYRSLLSAATASHIHGPAGFTANGGVLFDLAPLNGGAYGVDGALSGTASLTYPAMLNVIDNQTYINLHTTNYPSGEIRGQILR